MAASIIIGVLLAGYMVYVIRMKVRDMKNGKFCSGSCGNCTGCAKGKSSCSGKGGR